MSNKETEFAVKTILKINLQAQMGTDCVEFYQIFKNKNNIKSA